MVSSELRHIIAEFEWTRPRHGGDLDKAAPIFGYTPGALEQMLYRARRQGFDVQFQSKKGRYDHG